MSSDRLNEKAALITGASRGLGKAMAVALAQSGARIALVARDTEKLKEAAEAVRRVGGEEAVFQADVAEETHVHSLVEQVGEAFEPVQILINNAGINIRKAVIDFS